MKIAFFGTHQFAANILKGLTANPEFEVDLVITQPDRPVGRKQELQKSPVKIEAEKSGLEIDQPNSLKNCQFKTDFDIFIVAQYGLIIPEVVIKTPKFETVNVHTSLLPKYRGASPIQSALRNGEKETGITIMKMDKGMDTGPILTQQKITIDPDDTYLELDQKMSEIAIQLLIKILPKYILGEIKPENQDDSQATYCKKLTREDGKIDFSKDYTAVYDLYRGLTPWPGVWTTFEDKRLKLLKIKPSEKSVSISQLATEDDKLYIGCASGSIEILELQPEGKKKMTASQFLNGHQEKIKKL